MGVFYFILQKSEIVRGEWGGDLFLRVRKYVNMRCIAMVFYKKRGLV